MKRTALIAGLLVAVLLLPMMFMGALLALSGNQTSPSEQALEEIPSELIGVYRSAAATCKGLDWSILAAIHKVETGFGTVSVTSSKGAQGPMQFLPATFAFYGVDGDDNGIQEINDVDDAIFSAANLLCANGAGDPASLADAIWNYNHSQEYVNEVLTLADNYAALSGPNGVASAAASDLLRNPRIILTPNARVDLRAGVVDGRLVSVLAWIAQRHSITISVFKTGHSKYTRSGGVSHHYYGRAADVFIVDGEPVSFSNEGARQIPSELAILPEDLRPNELGHPFGAIGFPGGFTDADHRDHIHIGYGEP